MVDKAQAVNSANGTKKTGAPQQKTVAQLKAEYRNNGEYYVGSGESLYTIAKNANMNLTDFKKKTGLIKDSLQVGQIIKNIPTKAIKPKQGLQAFCRENNVDYHLFLALNCIDDKYIAQPGEKFFLPNTTQNKETTPTPPTPPTTPKKEDKKDNDKNNPANTKVTLGNGSTWVAKDLRSDAIRSVKAAPEFQKADNSYIDRPLPNIVNGKIEAACEVQMPISQKGNLKGKVVILNSGHGGYQQENGFFDAGACATRADAKGKMVPLEEWKVAKNLVGSLAQKLRGEGATVVIVSGAVKNGGMSKQQYLENLIVGKKGPEDVRKVMKNTKKSDMLFISVHFDSASETDMSCSVNAYKQKFKNGQTIEDKGDLELAKNIQTCIKQGFSAMTPEVVQTNHYVTKAMGREIPSVLLEVGNLHHPKIHATAL